jgi:acyl-CoA synthetase (AMP-forming)/AMP-acid ligase II
MTSSGTTGLPKKIGISWRCVENRIMHNATIGTMKGARSLSAIGPEFYPYPGAFIDWARGATVVFGPDNVAELANALTRLRPSVVALAPIQLKVLLDCLPPGFRAMPELTIGVSGSHTPRALREAVRLRLSPNLINAYMSTEAGLMAVKTDIGEIDDADVGPPSPWANVEIVDDEGRPAPPGEIGVIRIRSPDCVSGYIDDEEATARFFRNGWFYPGDVGFMSPEGRLRVEGRLDEVINFAGTKFIPHLIEGAVLACQGVMDVGVFSMRDETGFNAPWIAIVRGESLVEAELLDALRTLGVPPANFVWIDVIPRTPSGKVHREQLQTAVIRHREQESASAVETESLSKSDA